MKLLFCHDHVFYKFDEDYYSPGKLPYTKLKYYLEFFEEIFVVARCISLDSINPSLSKSNGNNVSIVGLDNLSSVRGLLRRGKVRSRLQEFILSSDAVIVRLPSEIGLLAFNEASRLNKPVLIELVADPYDCLLSHASFFAKFYAPILKARTKRACLHSKFVYYVTNDYLQRRYPSQGAIIGISDVQIDSVNAPKSHAGKEKFITGIIANPNSKIKGVEVAIKALSGLDVNGVDIQLRILGGFPDSAELHANNVVYDGVLSSAKEVMEWLDRLDFYIQPSFSEGLPRALVEAMSRGLPCLGTEVGGIPELLPAEALFAAGEDAELSALVTKLVSDASFYDELAKSCSAKASEYLKDSLQSRRDAFYFKFLSAVNSAKP